MELLISFKGKPDSFVHGVELGRLIEKMERGYREVKNNGLPIREENKLLITKSCIALGYTPIFAKSIEGWVEFVGLKNSNLN